MQSFLCSSLNRVHVVFLQFPTILSFVVVDVDVVVVVSQADFELSLRLRVYTLTYIFKWSVQ